MKIKKAILSLFTFLPLIVNLIALFFLPAQIPAHYGPDLKIDRYGSKYEILILPVIILVMGLIFLITSKFSSSNPNNRIALNIGIAMVLLFNALDYFLLYIQANRISDISAFGFNRFLLLAFGVFFIFVGNLMPMTRKNSFIGLRTKWSMKNDHVWKKCQLFGGISMIIAGIASFILAFVYPNLFVFVVMLILMGVIDAVYSYIAAKNDTHEPD